MGNVSPEQLAIAAAKADKSEDVAKLIQQAGSGLKEVFDEARANTVTLATVAKLHVVQGYLSEAAVNLLEAVAVSYEPPPKPRAIEIPGGG